MVVDPAALLVAKGADLGHQCQIVGIGIKRFADQPIGHVRAVEVAGVDMINAQRQRFTQHGARLLWILGRAEHTRSCQLHGPIAHAVDRNVGAGEGEAAGCRRVCMYCCHVRVSMSALGLACPR